MARLFTITLLVAVCTAFAGAAHVAVPAAVSRTTADDPLERVVARIDDQTITASEFKAYYIEYLLRTGVQDAARMRRALATQLVNERLLVAEARAEGIERTRAYRKHLKTARQKLSIELYLERTVLEAISVSEADLEDAFVRLNTTLTVRHLFAKTQEKAERLHARLLDGESFESLARESFADTALANNGGMIGEITFDETDPDFEDAAFGLAVGEISKPVPTAHGYSIIQVTDRFTKPILTQSQYAARKSKLHRLVLRKKRMQARSHFIRALADELSIRFREPAFGKLLGQITGTSLVESLESFLEQPLVEFAGGLWTVDDFRLRAQHTDPRRRAAVRTEADLKEFVTGLLVRNELLSRAEHLDGDPALEQAIQEEMEQWVLGAKKEELAGALEISDEAVRQHYAAHRAEMTDEVGVQVPFEAAAPGIRAQLRFERSQEHVLEYVASLRSRYDVDVNEAELLALPIAGRSFGN